MKGKVKFFNEEKGYGFILGDDDKEYFVHRSGVQEGVELNNDDPVEFELKETDRGMNAVEVRLSTEEAAEEPAGEPLDESVELEEPAEEPEAAAEEPAEEAAEEEKPEAPAEEEPEAAAEEEKPEAEESEEEKTA